MTPKQKEVFDFVKGFIDERGYSPSYEEIAEALGIKSKGWIFQTVSRLVEQGHLNRVDNRARSLSIGKTEYDRGFEAGYQKRAAETQPSEPKVWDGLGDRP